jgi:hypothetical protein
LPVSGGTAGACQGEMKAKLERRIADACANHERRDNKLSKARQLVKEAAAI